MDIATFITSLLGLIGVVIAIFTIKSALAPAVSPVLTTHRRLYY